MLVHTIQFFLSWIFPIRSTTVPSKFGLHLLSLLWLRAQQVDGLVACRECWLWFVKPQLRIFPVGVKLNPPSTQTFM